MTCWSKEYIRKHWINFVSDSVAELSERLGFFLIFWFAGNICNDGF